MAGSAGRFGKLGKATRGGWFPQGLARARTLVVVVLVIRRRHLPYLACICRALNQQALIFVVLVVSFDTAIFVWSVRRADVDLHA
jgi:hypothetical protein